VTTPARGEWLVELRSAPAGVLHGPWPDEERRGARVVALCAVTDAAVVLGSAQAPDVLDAGRVRDAGLDVVRRGSGGGAVLVAPDAQVWIDLWLPRRDPLWDDDVITSSWWVGEAWTRVLAALGVPGARRHAGRAEAGPWGTVLCFAGLGPGEVTVGGAKVVGVAQRRTRQGARLHTMVPRRWDPVALAGVLARPPSREALEVLRGVATGIDELLAAQGGSGVAAERVLDAVVRELALLSS